MQSYLGTSYEQNKLISVSAAFQGKAGLCHQKYASLKLLQIISVYSETFSEIISKFVDLVVSYTYIILYARIHSLCQ